MMIYRGVMMKNIIVLEDNLEINRILTETLVKEGYNVFSSFNAFDALKDFNNNIIDCVITDLMLPIMSGEEFILNIRKSSNVHIIVVSAKTDVTDKIQGLKNGADDYLFKPFIEEEIILKLKNLFNKKDYNENYITLNNKEVIFQVGKNQIVIKEQIVELTSVEYQMVKLLFQELNKVISREQFISCMYVVEPDIFDRVIDVHIRNIRKKVKKVYDKPFIKTIYGLGYTLVGDLDG